MTFALDDDVPHVESSWRSVGQTFVGQGHMSTVEVRGCDTREVRISLEAGAMQGIRHPVQFIVLLCSQTTVW